MLNRLDQILERIAMVYAFLTGSAQKRHVQRGHAVFLERDQSVLDKTGRANERRCIQVGLGYCGFSF